MELIIGCSTGTLRKAETLIADDIALFDSLGLTAIEIGQTVPFMIADDPSIVP